jgi:hypothetical protein
MYKRLHVRVNDPLFLSGFNYTFISSICSRNTQILNFVKIRPVGAKLFRSDGQTNGHTDITKLIVAFSNFTNGPKRITTMDYTVLLMLLWFVFECKPESYSRRNRNLSDIHVNIKQMTYDSV